MPPHVAACVFGVGILGLFWLEKDRASRTSPALWIPVLWLLISSSRMVSVWLQPFSAAAATPEQLLEGSPLDRTLLTCLECAGLAILLSRRERLLTILTANAPLLIFFAYCGLSVLWSDYPFVSMKRWVKGIGDLVMVLVVVTERDPGVALRALMVRLGFLLMPISVLLIKYFPEFGRGIENYTWEPIVLGVTTNKNQLGMISMICGLAATWRLLLQIRGNEKRRAGSIVAQSVVLSTALWLFWQANSMTALSCFGLATMLMTAMMLTNVARRPLAPHLLAVVVFAGAFASLFLNVGGDALQMMGRDSSLTGRTDIWDTVLRVSGSSLVGTGYESFWLGERLQEIWSAYWWQPNEAHNGYLEVFLNLGGLGLCLLAFAFIASYGRAVAAVRAESAEGAFKYSYLVVWTVYNFTESVTRSFQPLWSLFLLMAIAVPEAKPLAETEAVRRRRPEPHHFGSPIVAPRMRSHFAGSRRVEVTTRSSRP